MGTTEISLCACSSGCQSMNEGRAPGTECHFAHQAALHAIAGQQQQLPTSCSSLRRGSEAGGCRKGACSSMDTAATRLATPCWPPQA